MKKMLFFFFIFKIKLALGAPTQNFQEVFKKMNDSVQTMVKVTDQSTYNQCLKQSFFKKIFSNKCKADLENIVTSLEQLRVNLVPFNTFISELPDYLEKKTIKDQIDIINSSYSQIIYILISIRNVEYIDNQTVKIKSNQEMIKEYLEFIKTNELNSIFRESNSVITKYQEYVINRL